MNAQIAYEAYRDHLKARTRKWHELKAEPAHQGKSDDMLDAWIRDHQKDNITFYFMGDYQDMPEHTKKGWIAFAEHVGDGAEVAWNNYSLAARSNFHKDHGIVLPTYEKLASDQQEAVECAVMKVLEQSSSLKP